MRVVNLGAVVGDHHIRRAQQVGRDSNSQVGRDGNKVHVQAAQECRENRSRYWYAESQFDGLSRRRASGDRYGREGREWELGI